MGPMGKGPLTRPPPFQKAEEFGLARTIPLQQRGGLHAPVRFQNFGLSGLQPFTEMAVRRRRLSSGTCSLGFLMTPDIVEVTACSSHSWSTSLASDCVHVVNVGQQRRVRHTLVNTTLQESLWFCPVVAPARLASQLRFGKLILRCGREGCPDRERWGTQSYVDADVAKACGVQRVCLVEL